MKLICFIPHPSSFQQALIRNWLLFNGRYVRLLSLFDKPHTWRVEHSNHWWDDELLSNDHLTVLAYFKDGRIIFSTHYEHELHQPIARYVDASRSESAPRITCAPTKTAKQLAGNLMHRLIPDPHALPAKLLERHHAEVERLARSVDASCPLARIHR